MADAYRNPAKEKAYQLKTAESNADMVYRETADAFICFLERLRINPIHLPGAKHKDLSFLRNSRKIRPSAASFVTRDFMPRITKNKMNFMYYLSSVVSVCIIICVMYSSALEITKSLRPIS